MNSRQRNSEQNILLGIKKDFIMTTGSSCHKDITTLNIYAPKSKNGQIWKKQKSHVILVVGIPSAITDKMNRRKVNIRDNLNHIIYQSDPTLQYPPLHNSRTHVLFLHKMLAKTIFLPIKMSQNLKLQCIWSILSDCKGTELELTTEDPQISRKPSSQ